MDPSPAAAATTADTAVTPAAERASRWAPVAIAVVTVAFAARLLLFVNRFSVDVLFWDEWDFWEPMFRGAGLWDAFRWQHGPERQGLGALVLAVTAALSGWSARGAAFVNGGLLVLAAAAALALVRVLRGRWAWTDVLVPVIVLTLTQYEVLTMVANPAHGPLPLLLLFLFALALQVERTRLRLSLLAAVGVFATHTGFALFLALLAVAILGVMLAGAIRRRRDVASHALALAAVAGAMGVFLYGFELNPAAECFVFPDPEPLRYAEFAGVLFLRTFELQRAVSPLAGLPVALACAALTAWSGWGTAASLGASRRAATLFVLLGFSLLFAASSTVGRACMGAQVASSSRYVPYLVPFTIALYLVLTLRDRTPARIAGVVALALLVCMAEIRFKPSSSARFASLKLSFRACYFATGDTAGCSDAFPIYPDVVAGRIEEKLRFLRDRRLGLFKPE